MKVSTYRIKPKENENTVYTSIDRNSNEFKGWISNIKRGATTIYGIDKKMRDEVSKLLIEEYNDGTIEDEARYALIDYQLILIRMNQINIADIEPEKLRNEVVYVIKKIDPSKRPRNDEKLKEILNSYFDSYKNKSVNDNTNTFLTPHGITKKILNI